MNWLLVLQSSDQKKTKTKIAVLIWRLYYHELVRANQVWEGINAYKSGKI